MWYYGSMFHKKLKRLNTENESFESNNFEKKQPNKVLTHDEEKEDYDSNENDSLLSREHKIAGSFLIEGKSMDNDKKSKNRIEENLFGNF